MTDATESPDLLEGLSEDEYLELLHRVQQALLTVPFAPDASDIVALIGERHVLRSTLQQLIAEDDADRRRAARDQQETQDLRYQLTAVRQLLQQRDREIAQMHQDMASPVQPKDYRDAIRKAEDLVKTLKEISEWPSPYADGARALASEALRTSTSAIAVQIEDNADADD